MAHPANEIHHTYARYKEPTDLGKNVAGLSNRFFFFLTWNIGNRLKQTFLQINPFVACRHIQRRLIDLSKIEMRVRFLVPCCSRIVKFLIHDWFPR